jgi:hypothetical protein
MSIDVEENTSAYVCIRQRRSISKPLYDIREQVSKPLYRRNLKLYARIGLHRPPSVCRSSKAELNLYAKPLYEQVTKLLYTTLLAAAYTAVLRCVAGRNGEVEPEGTPFT